MVERQRPTIEQKNKGKKDLDDTSAAGDEAAAAATSSPSLNTQKSSDSQQLITNKNTPAMPPPVVQPSQTTLENDNGDDNDDNLSSPPSHSMSPPSSLRATTPRDPAPTEAIEHTSPSRTTPDNEPSEDARHITTDDTRFSSSRRKRASMFDEARGVTSVGVANTSDDSPHHALRRAGQINNAKLILVGYWRFSTVPDDAHKHSVVCFIDTRDRLRTRVQTMTRSEQPINAQYPMPHGGSWVPFEQIVFEDHLVGLDQAQVKEYVKIRTEALDNSGREEDVIAAEREAVELATRRVKYGPQPESGLPIAYGKEISDQRLGLHSSSKRRRTDSSFVPVSQHAADSSVAGPIPFTSVGLAQNLPPLDPLPGTRPTRILIGYWHGSNEPQERDRHAIYGILGQNDMFRVKVVRETRDGRFVDGNFPSGAGALWIHYEEVVLEPHLRSLSRHEVKEYCRVRQWQIDHDETDESREANEAFAVQEAQARVAHGFRTGQITMVSKPPDDKANLVPQISSGPHHYHQLRPAPSSGIREDDRRSAGARRSLPDSRAPVFRGANEPPNIPRPIAEPSRQLPPPNPSLRTSYGAPPPISIQTSAANAASIASQAISASSVGPPPPVRTTTTPTTRMPPLPSASSSNGTRVNFGDRDESHQANEDWNSPNRQRSSLSTDDAIMYGGIKYEKKKAGPFKDRHVSQGNIISINGEDYVEYRVLTKPTFF
ncbi:hypothetical protein CFIMG_002774RA [Ceratocystis fimbriata CBS 114723]|uniref:Uncharacterized protein n=1 Tax=Ceratocystis fimbriata CBS 114723 TaxID=1035309 RepID=A0A2C5X865_9PEZI|nr:hypothetical protein CFIMG_002774RA [Ceratocystis fimbriata CBS 114723]